MLSPADRDKLAAERRALAGWLAGDRARPLTLRRGEAYCIDLVVTPALGGQLGLVRRYLLVSLGDHAPGCWLKILCYRLAGARIGREACISPGVILDPLFPQLIEVESGACLGMGARLISHEYTAASFRIAPIRVCSGSVVGAYSTVRSGVTVGAGATIGFNSFVNRDVAPGDTVGGVPARSLARGQGSGFLVPGSSFLVKDREPDREPTATNQEPGTRNQEP
jgi:acetyltransferase-like isoleucine patch superfamily enzyme